MQEITHLRDRFTKHFDTGTTGVYEARIYTHPQHFDDGDGTWKTFEELVTAIAGGWATTMDGVTRSIENGYLTITYNGRSLRMRPTAVGMVDATNPSVRWRKLADADYSSVERQGRTFIVHDIFPNTDLKVVFTDNGITKDFTLRTKPNLPDPVSLGWNPARTYMVIVWDIQKPEGAVVRDTDGVLFGNGYAGTKDLLIQNAQGETIFTFGAGKAISSNPITHLQEGPVWYVGLGAQVPFGEAIPYSRAMIATYPLVIDPTTSIAISASANDGYIYTSNDYSFNGSVQTSTPHLSCDALLYYVPPDGKGGGDYTEDVLYEPFLRFDLSSISGSCSAASLNLNLSFSSSHTQYGNVILCTSDWGTLGYEDKQAAGANEGQVSVNGSPGDWKTRSIDTTRMAAKFGGWAAFRVYPQNSANLSSSGAFRSYDYTGTTYDPYLSITYETASGPAWVTPADASNIPPNTPVVWTSIVSATPVHFQFEFDTANTFSTGNLIKKRSYLDSGFEYWDGTAWQTLTSAGMPANKTGNNVRYTPSGPASGTWYRRVRQGK